MQFIHYDVTDWDSQVRAFQAALKFSPTKALAMVTVFEGVDVTGHLIDHIFSTEATLDGPNPPIPILVSIEVYLKGAFYTAIFALHYLRVGSGDSVGDTGSVSKSLIIVSSLAGYIDDTHSSAYTASKFRSQGLFPAIRAQTHQQLNIRVNAICP